MKKWVKVFAIENIVNQSGRILLYEWWGVCQNNKQYIDIDWGCNKKIKLGCI